MQRSIVKPGQVERLWTTSDGTMCILVTSETPPMYAVSLVRDTVVLRERRLYGRSSAQMVADSWSDVARTRD